MCSRVACSDQWMFWTLLYSTLLYVYSTLLYSTLVYSTLLSTWNINGLDDSVLGDKLDNLDFLNHVNKFDFIVLTETWTRRKVVVPDYNCYNSIDTQRSNSSKDRSSGGIMILYKNYKFSTSRD